MPQFLLYYTKTLMTFPYKRFETFDTPFYYYDLELLRQTLDAIRQCTQDKVNYHVHYAVKANANLPILQTIAQAGLGADCVSGGEVEAAFHAGFPPHRIVFAGVGKSDREILSALHIGIACFNVESLPELEVISQLAVKVGKQVNVAFRVNPNVDAHTHAKITTGLSENKFGIDSADLLHAIACAQSMPGIHYSGLHFHIGSQILNLEVYRNLCSRINELQDMLEQAGVYTEHINVGGGLGIDYLQPDVHPIPDFEAYFGIFARHLKLRSHQQLHFELGRSVVGQCGTLMARTLYVKTGHAKKFLILDAGFTDLIRPAMYGAHHVIQNLSAKPASSYETYEVVGPICESSDIFGSAELLPLTQRGDLIALRSAGAYGQVMASTYNCRQLPKAYYSE